MLAERNWSGAVACGCLSQSSRSTVRSWSASLMLIVAMAPSLNSKDVPPSTTMQASQHRERTHTLEERRGEKVEKLKGVMDLEEEEKEEKKEEQEKEENEEEEEEY